MLYPAIPSIGELWPILIVVVLLFGAKKIPELARSMGSGITQFKKGLKDGNEPEELGSGETPKTLPPEGSENNSQ